MPGFIVRSKQTVSLAFACFQLCFFHRQFDTATLIYIQHFDLNHVAFINVVSDFLNALLRDLRNMQQTFSAWHDFYECTEVHYTSDTAVVDLAHFRLSDNAFNASHRILCCFAGSAVDLDGAIIIDIDVGASRFGQGTNGRTALTNNVTDLLGVDLDGQQRRRIFAQLITGLRHGLGHFTKNMQTAFTGLVQRRLHDFFVNAFDLDIHLQRGDAISGTGHFKVHVAQVIFIAKNVGENGKALAFLDQTHSNTSNWCFNRYASIHQRQRSTTHRSHGRGTVRLGNFRHYANRVREGRLIWQDSLNTTASQTTVANFTTLRTANHASLTDTVWREVVMQHKAIGARAFQRINVLRITHATKSGSDDGLSFTTGKQ